MTKARDLANIISGGFDATDIPNLDTAKITSGTFVDARLPATALNSNVDLTTLSASNLTSGTVPTARLGSGTADATTFLRGDNSFASVTSPDYVLLSNTNASSTTAVNLDLFSSTYKNYKLLLSNITCTNNDWLRIRFRRSGADVSASWYYNANLQAYRTSSGAGDFNNSAWQVDKINFLVTSGLSNYPASSEITIFDPFATSYTMMNSYSTYWENNSSYRTSIQGAILYDATTSVTGITIYHTGGNFTGNIKLYGIK